MANESRRRAGQEITPKTPQVDVLTPSSLYKSLAVGSKSIRLLRIKPHNKFDNPIDCEIFVAAFEEKPRFEALSYKWGTDKAKQSILVNNVAMEVGQNLSDALQYLRRRDHPEEKAYWIDALCIDQGDIAERNQQVGIMRHIYFRASKVLVWLGQKYERYDAILPKLGDITSAMAKPSKSPKSPKDASQTTSIPCDDMQQPGAKKDDFVSMKLAKELYEDEYWNRVWIVQEIGLADKLEVCLGHCSTSWTHLIQFMTLHNLVNEGPVNLNKQRQTSLNGGCKLLELVDHFKFAKCKDQRDKIYGLVGLAKDARRFLIDYNKSLFDIWRDVMEFAKREDMLQDQDIISIGRLVKFTLMGNQGQPLEKILRPYSLVEEPTAIIDDPESDKVFRIPVWIIGCVQYVGPRIDSIVGDPIKQETWEYYVQKNYRQEAMHAHHESDAFLRGIVAPDGPDLSRACFSYTSIVQWTSSTSHSDDTHMKKYVTGKIQQLQSQDHNKKDFSDAVKKPEPQTRNTQLYQLHSFLDDSNNCRFGIASDQVRLGDLICCVESTSMALIIRQVESKPPRFQAIGTAVVAEDIRGSSGAKHANRLSEFRFKNMTTFIDSTLIFILLGCGSPDGIF